MDPSRLPQYPTWKMNMCMYADVSRMTVREKRWIFALMRNSECTHDMVLLPYGMTLGDFCCMNILST